LRAVGLGLVAAFFFASTFVLNRVMAVAGGHWVWSAVLRYLFMVPLLLLIVGLRGGSAPVWRELRRNPRIWLGWSTVGFGLFYAPLCFAAASGPAWLVASTWQLTIIAGSLLVPWLGPPDAAAPARPAIPVRSVLISLVILVGVALIQLQHSRQVRGADLLLGVLPVAVAAVAYPLGNRKMMLHCGERLDTVQRVLAMTLASLPFWGALALYGLVVAGPPDRAQIGQSLTVAVFSGVIATLLFFHATEAAHGNPGQLAAVEATQAAEVVFALLGEVIVLQTPLPSVWGLAGIAVIVGGMLAHSRVAHTPPPEAEASG
jgi:drug/metabolite transporter (DMT)-like permease